MNYIDVTMIEAVIALSEEYRVWVMKQMDALHPWLNEWRGPNAARTALENFISERMQEEQEELVALFWIGSGIAQTDGWEDTVRKAREWVRDDAKYLASMVYLGEFLREGLVRIGEV